MMQNEVFKMTNPVVLSELILLLVFTDDKRLNSCYFVLSLSYSCPNQRPYCLVPLIYY